MRRCLPFSVFCALVFFPLVFSGQQTPAGTGCFLPTPSFQSGKPNIFNDQQEQWLGDAQASQQEPDYDLLPEMQSAELDRIGQKLLAQLPPTPIHYHFRVYEAEDANGFSVAGGYVYISRKLITDALSEDEVAGVLAHEIGHIYTHQMAIVFTRQLKAMMNVTSLGSREDVEDKLQLLWNAPWKDRAEESEDDQEKDELLADRVGLYAMVRAGYAPKAFAENLDRVTANKGHTGNILTDVLGVTSEISLRVRVAHKMTGSLPDECKRLAPGSSPEFKAFQEAVRNVTIHPLIEPTPGLDSFKLDPPMRSALEQVHFSPNGAYVLAQDENSIHVLSRSPLKHLFSIDAPGAQPANFTPDSTHVTFHYQTMRVENWEIASGKRESYHELVDYEGCPQTSLSPDGKTFVCISVTNGRVWLKLTDAETGKRFYDNKGFYEATIYFQPWAGGFRFFTEPRNGSVAYSQDGRILVIASGTKAMGYDLVNRKPISLGNDLSHLLEGRMAFVDSNKLVFDCGLDSGNSNHQIYKLCETTFPEGNPINSIKLGDQWMEQVTKSNEVLVGPLRENAAILVDPSTGKASAAFKLDSLDVYDKLIASETERGEVAVGELGGQKMDSADLPISPMRGGFVGAFSPDGRFLAYSGRSRSSIWDLKTQKQVGLMRPFEAVHFDDQDQMFAEYQESHQKPGQNSHIDLKTGKVAEGAKFDTDQLLYGDVLVKFHPMDKLSSPTSNAEMQVTDFATGAQLWTKKFPNQSPTLRGTDSDSLLLIMDSSSKTAQDESAHAGDKLVKTSDKKGEWMEHGLLVELVNRRSGEVLRKVMLPETAGYLTDRRTASLYGDFLVVHGNSNNSVIYRLSDGQRLGAFYGRAIAGDGRLGLIAATNRDQEVTILDATTGKELKRVIVDHLPRAARFIAGKNALMVLTATQRVYTIDLPTATHPAMAQTK
jgi:WD40 repeat protein